MCINFHPLDFVRSWPRLWRFGSSMESSESLSSRQRFPSPTKRELQSVVLARVCAPSLKDTPTSLLLTNRRGSESILSLKQSIAVIFACSRAD